MLVAIDDRRQLYGWTAQELVDLALKLNRDYILVSTICHCMALS